MRLTVRRAAMRLTVRPLSPRILLQAITVADVAIYQVRIHSTKSGSQCDGNMASVDCISE